MYLTIKAGIVKLVISAFIVISNFNYFFELSIYFICFISFISGAEVLKVVLSREEANQSPSVFRK